MSLPGPQPPVRDDLQACRQLLATLAEDDDRRPAALSHLRRLVLTD